MTSPTSQNITGEVMTPVNFVHMDGRLPWRSYYAYLDSVPYKADKLFVRAKLEVHFMEEYGWKDDGGYRIVFCWVRKGSEEKFERCMSQLSRVSMLRGYEDYTDRCRELKWFFKYDGPNIRRGIWERIRATLSTR